MMKKTLRIVSVTAALSTLTVSAVDDAQYQSIVRLGELNGVAMHCKYFSETKRMKKAMITSLPKRRALGQAFDEVTNKAYLAFIEKDRSCPDAQTFAHQVDEAIEGLRSVFPKGKQK